MSFAACVRATYLDLVLNKVMIGCFFALQDTTLASMKKAKPDIE